MTSIRRSLRFPIICVACAVAALTVGAAHAVDFSKPPTPPQQAAFFEAAGSLVVGDACCGGATLAQCLKQSRCDIARRLGTYARWLAQLDTPADSIRLRLTERRDCLLSTQRVRIDTAGFPSSGSPGAPTSIVVYFSGTCPHCMYVLSVLDSSVIGGRLKGLTRVVAKPFTNGYADKALLAADKRGGFWRMVHGLRSHQQRVDATLLQRMTDSLGLPPQLCSQAQADSALSRTITASRTEARANGVTVSPTIFIDGVRYRSHKDPLWLIDACEYVATRRTAAVPSPR